jgi:hypothetical protein
MQIWGHETRCPLERAMTVVDLTDRTGAGQAEAGGLLLTDRTGAGSSSWWISDLSQCKPQAALVDSL